MTRVRFEVDAERLARKLGATTDTIARSSKRALQDILDDWKRESTDLAPLDKGTLRRGIEAKMEGDFEGVITANVTETWKGAPFNYAYYIHEVKEEIKFPTTPGTEAKFLEKPMQDNESRWYRMLEDEISRELRKEGW